ncbi:MAG: DUF4911 domain-containing protein [Polyangiaceae bacterium]|nr:DUF4911 domain-containing protein [Polyangiaceae bacterium]
MPLLGSGLVARNVRVPAREVVFVKGILDASNGIGVVFAVRGGDLVIATTESLVDELDRLLADLVVEEGIELMSAGPAVGPVADADHCDGPCDPLA